MNIIDNSLLEAPTVGKLITEKKKLHLLKDNHLYLISSIDEAFAGKAKDVFDRLMERMDDDQLLNNYKLEVLSKDAPLDYNAKFHKAMIEDKINFILPLYTPGKIEQQYLVSHTEETDLFTHLPLVIYTSERITKNSAVELMLKDAMDDADSFVIKTKSIWESPDFLKRLTVSLASAAMHPTFGMAVSKSLVKNALGKDVKYTHQKQIEIQKGFINDIHDIKDNINKEEKLARVKLMLGSASNEDILQYLLTLPDEGLGAFSDKVSPMKLAEQSKIKVLVRYVGRIENGKPANGRFRVFFEKGGVSIQVRFGRRSALLIYLIYLMDIIKSPTVNALDISQYGELFKRLFEESYGYDGGEEQFKTLLGKGNSEQELLRHSYGDIIRAVGKACAYFDESKTPFIISDAQSHLYILKKNILVDERLLNL